MNKIFTSGRLAADPVLSTVNGNQQVCKFRLASNNKRRDENNQYGTNWYNCTAWNKTGENIAKYFKKGNRINVEGDLTIRDYVDKNGAQRTSVDIDVHDFDFVDAAGTGAAQTAPAAPVAQPVYSAAPVTQPVYSAAPVAQPVYGVAPVQQPVYAPPAQPAQIVQPVYQPAAPAGSDDDLPF